MILSISNAVKDFFNLSLVPAVIVDSVDTPLWFNKAYSDNFEECHSINDFLSVLGISAETAQGKEEYSIKVVGHHSVNLVVRTRTNLNGLYVISFLKKEQMRKNIDTRVIERLFFSSNEMLLLLDTATMQIINANMSLSSFLGIPVEHMINMLITDIFPSDIVEKFLGNKDSVGSFFLVKYKSLTSHNYMLEISPTCSDESSLAIFNIDDVTSHNGLRDEKYQDILINATITDGVVIYEDNIVKHVNDIVCNMWGYEKQEIIGMSLLELFSKNESFDKLQHLTNRTDTAPASFTGLKKDGSTFNGRKVSRTIISNNKPTYIVMVTDDSEGVALNKYVEERKHYEQMILDLQKSMIAIFKAGVVTRCNISFLNYFGYENINEFNEQHEYIHELFIAESGYLPSREDWLEYVDKNKEVEHRILLQGSNRKEPCVFSLTVGNIDAEGQQYFVTFADITKIFENNLILKDVNDLLVSHSQTVNDELKKHSDLLIQQEKMATMGEMMGVITHQWKQPLNAIGLISQNVEEMLEDEELDRADIAQMMASIMRQVIFMGETVDNFREFFKPSQQATPFNLVNATNSTLMLISPLLKRSQVDVDVVCESSEVERIRVEGFPNEFKQVVMNIIINSKDAIQSKILESNINLKGKITINVEYIKELTEEVVLTFRDNGTGFSDLGFKKVFELNFTTKGSAGTGIGLYMVRMITEKMKGTISIGNWEEGAVAILRFPIADILGK